MRGASRFCMGCILLLAGLLVRPGRVGANLPSLGGDGIGVCYTGCGGVNVAPVNADFEQEVVNLVNEERDKRGLPPLKRSIELENAARYHAADMYQDNYFAHNSHDRSGGSLVEVCAWSSRIQTFYPNDWGLAENIAGGFSSPSSVMAAWMGSGGHQGNILSTSCWEIGVGYYTGNYWVQDFGRQEGDYPLIINRDAATTESGNVSLYIYGTWDEIRLRNDGGSWSAWMPFANTMPWTLGAAGGKRTVLGEMRTDGGQTAASSDDIILIAPRLSNLPAALSFLFSIPDQALLLASHTVTPRNDGNDQALSWSLSTSGAWFTASPPAGSTPCSFQITPSTFATDTVGTYAGSVTVTVVDPAGVEGSPHTIALTLQVVNRPFSYVYLPVVSRNYAQ